MAGLIPRRSLFRELMNELTSPRLGPVLAVALVITACGSSSPTGPTGSNDNTGCAGQDPATGLVTATGTMSAQVNGAPWTAVCIAVTSTTMSAGTILQIDGSDTLGISATAQLISIAGFSGGVGVQQIGLTSPFFAGYDVGQGVPQQSWVAEGAFGGNGMLTLTTFTPSSLVGTFSFTLIPFANGATGNKTITGKFNVTY